MEQKIEICECHEEVHQRGHDDDCKGLIAHLQRRVDDLTRENEELRQKTHVVTKKIETSIVDKTKTGLDEETVQKINHLERRLSEAEFARDEKIREVDSLTIKMIAFNDLRGELDVLRNKNGKLEQQLDEKLQELEALKCRFAESTGLREKDLIYFADKARELMELHKTLQEIVSSEVIQITFLTRKRDEEVKLLRHKIQQFASFKCRNPRDHEKLQASLKQILTLETELVDTKNKYTSLLTEYNNEITLVRENDKEINVLNRSLHQNTKEANYVIDKEHAYEDTLNGDIEALNKRVEEQILQTEDWKNKATLVPELENKLKLLETDVFKLQDRCKKFGDIEEQYGTQVEGLNTEIAILLDKIKNRESLYAELEKEKMTLVSESHQAQQGPSMLANVNENKNTEMEAQHTKVASLSNQVLALLNDISVLKTECDHLNAKKLNIKKALQEHTAQETELFAHVNALREEKNLLVVEIAGFTEKLQSNDISDIKNKTSCTADNDLHEREGDSKFFSVHSNLKSLGFQILVILILFFLIYIIYRVIRFMTSHAV